MTGADFLADTNAVIAWIKQDGGLARAAAAWSAPAVSLFTIGELRFGVLKSAKIEQNGALIESALKSFICIMPTLKTAEVYARVRCDLRRKGRPIPENDLWIAALAIENDLPLLTRDGHFREIESINVVAW